ncbi:hypothetical protein CK203_055453 [Vitis vinifera]|uniref:Peptidase A2 domain-containing protein n=1 Tax=Vitis vinifera TaxID=29760 RepID=A0A438GJI0_VITVI|nr:hypothetical protein CK203_055453 [Vitis vinifera]
MDDLFLRAIKYSMLEDDVRAATQQVLDAGQASRSAAKRSAKPPDRPRSFRSKAGGAELSGTAAPHTPLHILREALLYDPRPVRLQRHAGASIIFVERLIKAGHLKQYLRSNARVRDTSRNHNSGTSRIPAAPKAVINYIHGGPLDEEYDSKRKRQRLLRAASVGERVNSIRLGIVGGGPRPIDGTIIFPLVDPTRILQPHRDALILSLEMGDFDVRRILVDPGSSVDLLQASVISHMGRDLIGLENLGRILSGFNGAATTSLGDIVLPVQVGPVTLNVQFSVVQDLSPFNVILGRTWLHYMKVILSTYHQMAIKISEESTHLTHINSLLTPEETRNIQDALRQNHDVFAWVHSNMKGIHPSIVSHKLNVLPTARPVRQRIRRFHPDRQKVIRD